MIARSAGGREPLPSGTLSPQLSSLVTDGILADDLPISTKPDTKNHRYRITDPYLRFWLAFGREALPLSDRGLGHIAAERVRRSWSSWRGRAVEPFVRESVTRICLLSGLTRVTTVGGWWNRQNSPEIDLVGADRAPVADHLGFIGSIKWHDSQLFGRREYEALVRSAPAVPGGDDVPLVGVCRSGFEPGLPLAHAWTPEDLVNAWTT